MRWLLDGVRLGLAEKLALCLLVSGALIFAAFGWWNLRLQRRASEELIVQSADRITDLIQRSTRYQMLHNDREALYQVIRDIGSEPGIGRVRIFNKVGRISFSSVPGEVGGVVDKAAEACYGCHAQAEPLARLHRPDRARVFAGPDRQRVLAMIRPIENEASCSSATCHAHPPDQKVLGVIDAHLSLATVDAQAAAHERQLLLFTLAALVVISLVSAAFIRVVLHKPVKELMAGTRRVAGGELGYRLAVHSHDELGDLAASFNKMTAELAAAHAEVEERVRRKTRELEQAHRSLVSAEKMASIGKLAATVAHEVNNPLFGILTYARLGLRALESQALDLPVRDKVSGQLRIIEQESRRCGEIMRNLLTFARQAPRKCEPNQINTLVERSLTLVRHQLELSGIALETRLARDLPEVRCDAGQIQQVVLALLVNAAEAMPQGGRLTVVTELDDAGGALRVRVRDTGNGIPPDVLPHIFEPFFTTKEDQQRTGLGLAVAWSILEQHGGSIRAESTGHDGAEFVLTLPVGVLTVASQGDAA